MFSVVRGFEFHQFRRYCFTISRLSQLMFLWDMTHHVLIATIQLTARRNLFLTHKKIDAVTVSLMFFKQIAEDVE